MTKYESQFQAPPTERLPRCYFPGLIDDFLETVYHLAYRMTLDAELAAEAVYETFLRAYYGEQEVPKETLMLWLLKITCHVLESRLPQSPELSFDFLDDVLRSDSAWADTVYAYLGPEREALLWEQKQNCLSATVNCIMPGERVVFVLGMILGLPDVEAAAALGIRVSAYRVRLSQARKKVSDYLTPRCEHIHPSNPCHCNERLGVALRAGFIKMPAQQLIPLLPFGKVDRPRSLIDIYSSLPQPQVPDELRERLLQAVETSTWSPVRAF